MLENPRTLFGVHSVCFYDRSNRLPIAFLRVLGNCNINLTPEFTDLAGGSQMMPWDSEPSAIDSEASLTAREYPIEAMELLLAGEKTEYTENADGRIDVVENVKGESIIKADTGIATITVTDPDGSDEDGGEVDLKEGEYVIKAVSATTVDLYALTDANFNRGESKAFLDNTLKITESPISITTAGECKVPGYGVTLNGGSGTIALTIGDTARFTVRRPSVKGFRVIVGQTGANFPEVGVLMCGQLQGNGGLTWVDVYRVKAAGMPVNFEEKGYSEWSITLKILYDAAKNGAFEYVTQR